MKEAERVLSDVVDELSDPLSAEDMTAVNEHAASTTTCTTSADLIQNINACLKKIDDVATTLTIHKDNPKGNL